MSHVLFEEDGAFKAGTILSDAGTSLQVEHASGKRSKVKAGHVLLKFDAPEPAALLPGAQTLAEGIDLDFLWECAPQEEFGFTELAAEYFGVSPTASQSAALLLKLQAAPVYFHRKGRGRFRPAPAETVRLALAAIERKRVQEETIEAFATQLAEGRLPEGYAERAAALLVKPDKQSIEYRALERACERLRSGPERLLLALGAFASPRRLHLDRFACEHFPRGLSPTAPAPRLPDLAALPAAGVEAFSIDDSSTTEIDDALSVQTLSDGRLRVGVHIAAPALAIDRDDPLDLLARDRMSTVYMPGDKITMLPESAIRPFSLDEGTERPALSLYVDLDEAGTAIVSQFSRVDRVRIAANLRHDLLDATVTEASLEGADPLPFGDALRTLWRLTLALSAERDRVRGKPEPRFKTDFSFKVEGERVEILQRRRDAPLDRIVAEMMILANSAWGRLLADHSVPGIYRSQQAGRTRMGTHALPHQGLGVAQYAWSSSPLRRYVDLTNQAQLIAVLAGEKARYASNDAELFSIVSAFEAKYAAYAEFQQRMERYWCLRWITQHAFTRLEAVVVRDDLVRLAQAPLYFRLVGVPPLAPGRRILIDVLACDEIDLSLEARFVELAAAAEESPGAGLTAAEADEAEFAEE